ncbi:hypothetical protein ACGRH2_23260 [Vibrio barjaei]|uniref:Uncharacterized protein n=1 Tax=Vibrio barjaei TaxID=1676683 RepID=A0ABW7INY5_9VIBR
MSKLTQIILASVLLSLSSTSFANEQTPRHGEYVGEAEVLVRNVVSTKVKTCLYKGSTEEPVELKWGKTLTCPDSITINGNVIHEGDGLNTSGHKRM